LLQEQTGGAHSAIQVEISKYQELQKEKEEKEKSLNSAIQNLQLEISTLKQEYVTNSTNLTGELDILKKSLQSGTFPILFSRNNVTIKFFPFPIF
jgi:septal ring factor EnvC (AmiA/AmiB activator)